MYIKNKFLLLVCVILAVSHLSLHAQSETSSPWSIYGDVRISYTGNNDQIPDFENNATILRLRPGVKFKINESHALSARLAYRVSHELEELDVTAQAQNGRLGLGQLSFDELYYQYSSEDLLLKAGRFQHKNHVYTNSGRSIDRFPSNNVNVNWSDGMYLKTSLNDVWYGEAILELIEQNQLAYPYKFPLTFNGNDITPGLYLGVSNDERDEFNIIQKSAGIQYFHNAYFDGFSSNSTTEYAHYLALTSRIAFDFDGGESLKGGSWRVAGEAGYNIQGPIDEGIILNTSVGVNSFAERHNLMIEFTKVGDEWVSATVYAPNADEMEIRYTYKYNSKISMDTRLRIRDFRDGGILYGTFVRGTYKF